MNRVKMLTVLGLFVLVLVLPLFVISLRSKQDLQQHASGQTPTPTTIPGSRIHVSGTHIIDANGNVLQLRGAMIDSFFAYSNSWQTGAPTTKFNQIFADSTFAAMQAENMNVVRLDISQWIQQTEPSGTYMTLLDQAISRANAHGIYVVLDFHDNVKSGAIGVYADDMLHVSSRDWWVTVAQKYKNNPMILFDVINEPAYGDWNIWSNGSGDIVGMLDVIAKIRAVGANNLIVLEPGAAGKGIGGTQGGGWTGFDPTSITDQNIIFSKHDYASIIKNYMATLDKGGSLTAYQALFDAEWDKVLHTRPIYYGEWAVQPNPQQSQLTQCANLTNTNADMIVTAFLTYMQTREAGWSGWQYSTDKMITDFTTDTPTTFHLPGNPEPAWKCADASAAHLGMGDVIKRFLTANLPSSTPTPIMVFSPTPSIFLTQTPPPHPSDSPTPDPNATLFAVTICPHGIGNCGDNANPNGGTKSPLHQIRPVTLTVHDISNNQVGNPITGNVLYDASSSSFQGTIAMGNLQSGTYFIVIQMNGYLSKQVGGIVTITAKQTNIIPAVSLTAGNIDNNQTLDLTDYNILIDCFDTKAPLPSCTNHHIIQPEGADLLDDDGVVDAADYNLFLRELSVQRGQ